MPCRLALPQKVLYSAPLQASIATAGTVKRYQIIDFLVNTVVYRHPSTSTV